MTGTATSARAQDRPFAQRHNQNRAKHRCDGRVAGLRMKLSVAGVILPGGILEVGPRRWRARVLVCSRRVAGCNAAPLTSSLRACRGLLAGSGARDAGRRVWAQTTATPAVRDGPCRRPDYAVLCRGSCTGAATGGGARPLPPLPSLAVAVIAGAAHAKVPGKCIGPTAVASLAIAMSSDAAARGGAASRRGGCAEWTSCSRSSGMPPRVMYAIQDRHSLPVTPGSPPSRSGCRPGVRHGDALVPAV